MNAYYVVGGYSLVKNKTRDSFHTVIACSNCGLKQLYPLPDIEEDAEYYNHNQHDKGITPSYSVDDIFLKFEFQNLSRIEYLQRMGIQKSGICLTLDVDMVSLLN